MSVRFWLLPVFLCGLATASADDRSSAHKDGLRENRPDVWALQHVTVVVRPGQVMTDATLVVRDGKIDSVQTGGDVPADARGIDLSGKTIYAGLIDAYAETEIPGWQLRQTAGYWNPQVVPHLSVARRLTENEDAAALRKQGIVAQLRAPGNAIIRGQSALVTTGTDDSNQVVLRPDIAQHMQLTLSQRGRDQYPGSPMGAVALARQAMYDAGWYREAWKRATADSALPRPERNVALAALEPLLTAEQPAIIECTSELYVLRADRFAREFGLSLIIRGSGSEYQRLKDIAATDRPLILPLNFPKAPNVSTPELADNATLEALMHWDLAPENPARVAAAGIPFAFTTDRLDSVDDFLSAIRRAVERGLSADAALAAVTQTPAELYGVTELLGTVEAGKLASFVVTDGDLFAEDTEVIETWVDGTRFEHDPAPARDLEGRYILQLKSSGSLPKKLHLELKVDSGRISDAMLPEEDDAKAEGSAKSGTDKKKSSARSGKKKKDERTPVVVDLRNVALNDYAATARFDAEEFGQEGIARVSLLFSEVDVNSGRPLGMGQLVWPSGDVSSLTFLAADEAADIDSGSDSSDAADDDDDDDEASQDDEADDKGASFDVNYPLGAFGRTKLPTRGTLAFTNATIWTCGPAGILENATLLIHDGTIHAVGIDVDIPKSATVVNLKGQHITPGIIDCHSHMASDGGINEATQAITCEVRIGDFIDCTDITIYRQLAGGVTAVNILHGSANPIGGQNQVIKLRWGASDEQMKFAQAPGGVKFALGENVKQSNWGDDYRTRYPQTRMGVEELFRDAFTAAREYGQRWDDWRKNRRGLPPRRDLELDALLEMVEGTRWIHCHSYRQDEILALIRVLDDFDITIGTFQHILEGYKVADAMAKHGAMASAFSDWWAYKFEVFDAIPFGGALMHEAGVVVSFNSDDAELGTRLNLEAAKAVKYGGVSPEEALKFVTLNPARQLRIDEYVGSLEVGKHADFAVWNGDPLSSFSHCRQTWIDGARYFDHDEDAAAREQVDQMRNTLIQKILSSGAEMQGADEQRSRPRSSNMWPRHDEYCRHSKNDNARLQSIKSGQ